MMATQKKETVDDALLRLTREIENIPHETQACPDRTMDLFRELEPHLGKTLTQFVFEQAQGHQWWPKTKAEREQTIEMLAHRKRTLNNSADRHYMRAVIDNAIEVVEAYQRRRDRDCA